MNHQINKSEFIMKISNIQYCIDDMSQNEYIAFMKHEHNVSIYFNMQNDADDELTIVGRDNDVKNAMKIMFQNDSEQIALYM